MRARFRAEITLFPEGVFDPQQLDGRPVARVRLVPDATVVRDIAPQQAFAAKPPRRPR